MVWVAVIRGNGDHHAEPIVDQLISEEVVAINRGRTELDTHGYRSVPRKIVIAGRAGIRLGQTVEVNDELIGEVWVGKIQGIEHDLGDIPTITLDVERPVEFSV